MFEVIETMCNIWFTIEIVFRFISCPRKLKYLMAPVNVIDIVATLTFYLDVLFSNLQVSVFKKSAISLKYYFVQIF